MLASPLNTSADKGMALTPDSCVAAGRRLLQFQFGGVISALNAGQLNQAAVQQLAQAGFGAATNLAGLTQTNVDVAGAPPKMVLHCHCSVISSAVQKHYMRHAVAGTL